MLHVSAAPGLRRGRTYRRVLPSFDIIYLGRPDTPNQLLQQLLARMREHGFDWLSSQPRALASGKWNLSSPIC